MWTVGVLLLAAAAGAITPDQFYPYGAGRDQRLPHGANVSSPQINLNVPIAFYGEMYDYIYVNNYGILTFRESIPLFLNAEFPLPYPSIAAFYTNIDTSETGAVYFRESNETHVLKKAEESIQNNFQDYYDFVPTSVFLATWIDVTYLNESNGRRNSFQVAVISNGTDSFVELLYPERQIQWIQKETFAGYSPDAKAQAGFIAEDGRLFTLRGSGSHQIRNIVSWSNIQDPGRYVYRVGIIPQDGNIIVPDQYDQYEVEVEEESKTCAQSGTSVCHTQARCVDYQAGICCQCIEGFYGNGKSCIKNNVPLRLNGKLNGVINNVNLNDVNVQAYVVIADGRTYTALTQAPPSLGTSLQTLSVLGGVIGWLFAKPIGSAKNGYQLTGGVFNYTADIHYPATGDRVTINQEFLGHDVFDQITFDTDIRGSIPTVSAGAKIEVSEFQELYTSVAPGIINSVSSRTYTNKATSQTYEQRVTQTFSYIPCRFAPVTEEDKIPVTLKVVKNYLGYEMRENIVRYGTTNKVILNDQVDPCIEGRNTCAPHSTCVAEGDTYTCVCQSGFTNIYYEKSSACIDIDECVAGTHNCDTNADCYNHEGGFQCRCRENYEGNGVSCQRISRCRDNVCDSNATCLEGPQGEPTCVCNDGFVLQGNRCTSSFGCDQCSPDAHCQYNQESNSYSCQCNEGYIGNGYDCEVEETTEREYMEVTDKVNMEETDTSTAPLKTTSYAPTESEYNEDYVLANCGVYGCYCPEGYSLFKDSRNVDLCRVGTFKEPGQILESNDTSTITCATDSDCPPNAICSFSGEQYYSGDSDVGHCVCPEGYEGDAYECLEKTGPTCSCGIGGHCIETNAGDMMCVCDIGYHGDGYDCRPNFSCRNDSDCEINADCRPDAYNELVCQCISGYVKDQSDACIPDGQLCNGAVCAEHASCLYDAPLSVSYCQCDTGFAGDGITSCVPQGRTCDIANDCNAYAVCTPVESTYQCVCREGFTGDGYVCNPEINCKTNHNLCDQHASCLKTSDGYECECNTGYNGNGSYCALNPRQSGNFLVASDGASVYRVPFIVTPREFATPLNSGIYQIAVGIDVDCHSGRIYWGDVSGNAIKRAAYDGSESEMFLSTDVQAPEGISVDWTARNIFWTDAKKLTIEVANMDTKVRKVLFRRDGIFNPRGIVVHPSRGKIFWSDWNRSGPKIEWANMDGSERGVFLDQADVKLPNSLAIDWARDRLCYADAGLFSVRCVGIDTLEREVIASNCSYPFGLAINGEQFYWSDWKKLKIEYLDNLTQLKGSVPIATASRRLYGVAVAPDQCPAVSNVCQNRNGYCQMNEICLPNGQGSRTCVPGD